MSIDRFELEEFATKLAETGGACARQMRETAIVYNHKSSPTDIVTDADIATEAAISEMISDHRPDDEIFGEESGTSSGTSGVRWIVDPIDGTVNYAHGLPIYSTSVAAEVNGVVESAAVQDVQRRLMYSAHRGGGAALDGTRLRRRTPVIELSDAVIGTGFDYRADHRRRQATTLLRVLPAVADIRRGGSAALEICWAAVGHTDGYFELGVKRWDIAAAGLIALEAGLTVREVERSGELGLIVGTPEIVEQLEQLLQW